MPSALGRQLVIGGVDDWRLDVRAGWGPGWSGGAVTGVRWEVRLEKDQGPLRAGVGFRRWWLGGGGRGEVFEGPFLSLSVDDRVWRQEAP